MIPIMMSEDGVTPRRANNDDCGMDLFSSRNFILEPGKRIRVATNVRMEISALGEGVGGFIWGKSGVADKYGVIVLGGVIDPQYRKGIDVVMFNSGDVEWRIRKGDAIAQIVFMRIVCCGVKESYTLSEGIGRIGGFGSTGI